MTPTFDDVLNAAARLDGIATKTPLIESRILNERIGGRVLLKLETLQHTGAFKFRGAYNKISRLSSLTNKGGIVAYSGGNHAQGAAAAARLMDIPALIMMPRNATQFKIERTRDFGAEIRFYEPEDSHLRMAVAAKLADDREAVVVPSYDDLHIIAGQGTVGLEIFQKARKMDIEIDSLLTPCSGGGLSSGCALVKESLSPNTKLFTVEPEGFDDTARSLRKGLRLENEPGKKSICDALLMSPPGEITFPINQRSVTAGIVVTDDQVKEAMIFAFFHLKLVLEPGGAVALATILAEKHEFENKTTAIVCSGGNIDQAMFHQLISKA